MRQLRRCDCRKMQHVFDGYCNKNGPCWGDSDDSCLSIFTELQGTTKRLGEPNYGISHSSAECPKTFCVCAKKAATGCPHTLIRTPVENGLTVRPEPARQWPLLCNYSDTLSNQIAWKIPNTRAPAIRKPFHVTSASCFRMAASISSWTRCSVTIGVQHQDQE